MFDIITALSTNLFRTFIIKKFMSTFFLKETEDKKKETIYYFLFFLSTAIIYLAFHFPPVNIIGNMLMLYFLTQLYKGEKKKKILVSMLIYGINMACDILAVYSFSNYVVGESYNEIAAYITVFLISICEYIVERFFIKKKDVMYMPPYGSILILIPVISIAMLFILLMNNLQKRIILITVSAGILLINMLIFYLYNALLATYLKIEENELFERQIASYSNQLNILMQSEEKISALRHDMKHHLNELLTMADKGNKVEIINYIHDMQMFMKNNNEFASCGNKNIDSLLNYMLNKAEQSLKDVEYKIRVPKDLNIPLFDLNVILGNLLDNAILAASNSNDRWLSVVINYDKGMLFIEIKNSYENSIIKQGEKYKTTKKEINNHGIGLQNVRRVVNNYDGDMEILVSEHVFHVKIMLYTLTMI